MKRSTIRSVSVVAMTALVAAMAPAISTSAAHSAASPPEQARELRSIYTSEYGVSRPTGVTYDAASKALLVAGPRAAGGTKLVELTPTEDRLGTLVRPRLDDGGNVSFDPHEQQLVTTDPEALPQVDDARGSTYSPDGTRHVLDAASDSIVSVQPDGTTRGVDLDGLEGQSLNGIAYNTADGMIYVADSTTLYAVGADGAVTQDYDLSDADIADMQAMTFAPSADPTDAKQTLSLYVADAGDTQTLGRIAEITMEPAVMLAASSSATLVATRDLSRDPAGAEPTSPDPSGIAHLPGRGLIVSDSEVNEMPLYKGVNLFERKLDGTLVAGGTTLDHSNEPTGVAFDSATGTLYTSDDDKKSVFAWKGGSGGVFGSGETPTAFKTSAFGLTDPEGISVDTLRGDLLLVDGVGAEVFRLTAGANGVFDGVAPGGDDVATQFDLSVHGAEDPEGIEYDAGRDTIAVVDGGTEAIYELDTNGSLLNVVDISGSGAVNAAGLAIAPASIGSGNHYYIADRGLDNNSHPTENDGKMYEMSADLAPITNRPPFVDAGIDQMMDVPDLANLSAAGTDDGVPGTPLTYTWSKLSGPAGNNVTFAAANQPITTAKFSEPGKYVLRVTVSDGELTDTDDVTVDVYQPGGVRTTTIPIAHGADDALEGGGSTGDFVDLASADNELGHDGTPAANPDKILTGLRFSGIPVPKGGEIVSAKIQFKVDEGGSEPASYVIKAEAQDNAPMYASVKGSISARVMGPESVPWAPPAWPAPVPGEGGLAGAGQLTPDLKALVQAVVNRPGWVKGNAVNFTIGSATAGKTGRRTAEAKDGLTPPVLILQFKQPVPNVAPVVNAGADRTTQLPARATLDGSVVDDGLPTPPALTQSWSKVSGPGAVTFGNAAMARTTAAFSKKGTYVLRLTGSDGVLSAFDDVKVTVKAAVVKLALKATPGSLVTPGKVRLTGRMTEMATGAGVGGGTVRIYVTRSPGTRQRLLRNVTTAANGTFSFREAPKVSSRYVAAHGAERSTVAKLTVRPRLTARLNPVTRRVGVPARITGVVSPVAAKLPVQLQRRKGSKWVTVQRKTLAAGAKRAYAFSVRHQASGTFRYRVVVPARAGRASTVAPGHANGLKLRVYRAAIVRVKHAGKEFVTVRNTGRVSVNLRAWKLRNARSGREVRLPAKQVKPGRSIRVHTGRGGSNQNNLYLGKRAMWGPRGVAVLKSNRLIRVHRFNYRS